MQDNQEALLQRATQGDADALTSLLHEHGPVVRQGIAAKIPDRFRAMLQADDVMQVTYIEAFRYIHSFTPRGPGSFQAWLRRIAENNRLDAIKWLERHHQEQPLPRVAGDSSVDLIVDLGYTLSTPSRAVAAEEANGLLSTALDELPPDYAQVIRLFDLEQKPVQQIAETMKRSLGAIYMLRARAHDALRGVLPDETQFFTRHP